ncbi:No apical meristem-associated, C-terminal domain containing protein [Parasponia andersonii]|uniref:No apical meristem-associated, C-terminal domain containing protein n=1 Tax=Parasponia andersonii TaxID=3476 RepID=A0A2P5A920_PARAD|nr:No apical meristem-associated, C-terminal domain containing protein [Parasponia andersonii]
MEESQNLTKRGKSFTNNQDVAICNAWLAIVQDPVVGNLQTSNNFWDRVLEHYTKNANDESIRSRISIISRWGRIMRSCNKFRRHLTQIENRRQSGMTEAKMVLQAKQLYIEIEKKKFIFDHCWEILKQSVKWQDLAAEERKNATISTINDFPHSSSPSKVLGIPVSQYSNTKRLICMKAEKESQKKSNLVVDSTSSSCLCDLMFEFNKQSSEAQELKAVYEERKLRLLEEANERERRKAELELKIMVEKNDREQKEMDDKIMMMDTSGMDSRTRAYFDHRKAEILAKIVQPTNLEHCVPLPTSPSQD